MKRTLLVGYALALVALLASPAGAASYSDDGLNAYRMRNDLGGELQYVRAWVKAEPSNALARRRLAEVYLQMQDTRNALTSLQQAVRLAPNDARSWLILGNVYGWRKQYSDAARALRRAAQLMPAEPQVWQNLAAMLSLGGDDRGAIGALQSGAQAAAPRFTSADWYNYGNRLAFLHQAREAIPYYRRAVALDPRNAAAWNNLGTLYSALGQRTEAAASYRQSAALNDSLARKNLQSLAQHRPAQLFHNQDMRP